MPGPSASLVYGPGFIYGRGSRLFKHIMDASGPGIVLAYFINQIIPAVQPIVIFLGAIAALAWYAIRFHDRIKYGPDFNE
jgi:hypothetical protein